MKSVKIPTNEKECKDFLEGIRQYAAKRGVKIYSIIAYSTMCEATITSIPDLKGIDPLELRKYGNGFMDEWDNFKQIVMSLGDDLHDL